MVHRANHASCIFFSAVVLIAGQAHAVTYTATLLHPQGSDMTWGEGNSNSAQVGFGSLPGETAHVALMWTGSSGSVVSLNPTGFTGSRAQAASGTHQVGFASGPTTGSNNHAFMWSGSAESAIDLHPPDHQASFAMGVSSANQVGYGWKPGGKEHALLWNGNAQSVVDLHPSSGYFSSQAVGVFGQNQVGFGRVAGNASRALLWSGTAESVVSLHPPNAPGSRAYAVSNNTQVGYADFPSSNPHAALWHGTAASIIDLNPVGFDYSEARSISSAGQAGLGRLAGTENFHALLWNGTVASAVDLHPFLGAAGLTYLSSRAMGINDDGVIVGYAYNNWNTDAQAVMWTPIVMPGDFNRDGKVDARDYITWREGLGTTYTEDDYKTWRSHFGEVSGGGSLAAIVAVPEPSVYLLSACTAVFLHNFRRRHY
jgi:hypothetical protein